MIFPPILVWLSAALLFLAPAVNLVWRGGSGYCFFALTAIGIGTLIANRHKPDYFKPLQTYGWYTAAMLAFMVSIGVQQLVHGYWLPRQFDALSRFMLALVVFLLLRQLPSRALRMIGWGCAAGALAVGVWALIDQPQGGWTPANRLNNYYTNAIPFGDTALLLAFLSLFTLGWDAPRDWRPRVIKALALLGGGYASYLSGTRGGWLAVPLFIILLGVQYRWFTQRKRLLAAVLTLSLGFAVLLSTGRIEQRVVDATTDVTLLNQGDTDTSIGLRVQLWQASWHLFTEHPVYGIGKGRLMSTLGQMAERGEVKAEIVNERAHSDFFSTLAEMGTIGVLCLLLFYFGTSVYFWRNRHADDPAIRAAAYSGLAVSGSTIVFGLTIDVLVPIMVTVLLALLNAAFLAMIDARKRELASAPAGTASAVPGPPSGH
ncbi:O-antigen ligase family protein [Paraburkholderia bonniea]|uniref:O-antigen ligase family protein n=1 Tax=Paraburkholderia bonniea TaxID=2152891 RepID=UPI00129177F3|nr:O-antigen ligase family protein [Paraburkholderia bonniea]WJF91635.1 O-antigen ligase family protein [Paraburkholderia bonniea]WJF94954.1 O-antigen ligase family protein [Paraburkholderia bonniea]